MFNIGRSARVAGLIRSGDAARDARDWPSAARLYQEAVDIDPSIAPIWVQLGHALKESGDLRGAEGAYRRAIELAPEVADTHLQLGHALKLSGHRDLALQSYLDALRRDPASEDARRELLSAGWSPSNIDRAVPKGLKPGTKPSASDVQQIVLDVSDLMHYFLNARVPTGIQRVQINVISSLLTKDNARRNYIVACFTAKTNFWVQIPKDLFLRLVTLALSGGDRDDPIWELAIAELTRTLEAANRHRFEQRAVLVNLGTSWWLQNYFLMIREAKRLYGVRYVPFVHDLIPLFTPEHCIRELTQDFISWLLGVFFHADAFLVNSEATKADLARAADVLGHKIPDATVVRLDGDFKEVLASLPFGALETGEDGVLDRLDLRSQDYVLFVSTIESRKNHLLAFDAWLELIKRRGVERTPHLVCVGNNGWMVEAALARLNSSSLLRKRVHLVSMIPDVDLEALYANCLFTLYPSSYEGWGLPVTESLVHGKVPLASNVSSIPEAGGPFAVYFDPGSRRDLIERAEQLIDDTGFREGHEAKIRNEFKPRSWQEIAEQIATAAASSAESAIGAFGQSWRGRVWAIPAIPGRYYSFSRNRSVSVWRDMIAGEMFRVGTNWHPPDDFGSWTRDGAAEFAFRVPDDLQSGLRLYIGVEGLPAGSSDGTYEVSVGHGPARSSRQLPAGQQAWEVLQVGPEDIVDGVIVVRIRSHPSVDLAPLTGGGDDRVVSIGVRGFFFCAESDLAARLNFLEAVQLGHLTRLSENGTSL